MITAIPPKNVIPRIMEIVELTQNGLINIEANIQSIPIIIVGISMFLTFLYFHKPYDAI